jgi:hypothetical protein
MKGSRYKELAALEKAFEEGQISPEVALKRAGQLAGAFKHDVATRSKVGVLWNRCRRAVANSRENRGA